MCHKIPGLLLAATRAANNCCIFIAFTPASMKPSMNKLLLAYHIQLAPFIQCFLFLFLVLWRDYIFYLFINDEKMTD